MQSNLESKNLLDICGLKISFFTSDGEVQAVRGVSLTLKPNTTLGIVGESGCGKSVTSLGVMKLLQDPGKIVDGDIYFEGKKITDLKNKEMRKIRGKKISMIFQDPMTSLNPVFTIGNQIREIIKEHNPEMTKEQIKARSIELLELVGIPDPVERIKQYPHEFSGGMRQRAMIAIALANNPLLLIADEPTTALDVTIQAQILDLMKDLRVKFNTSIILITHDLGVVADVCDEIRVMYAGLIVEEGSTVDIFNGPLHPYTWGLMDSIPKISNGKNQRLIPIEGQPPDLLKPPVGCSFAARCKHCMVICREKQPPFIEVETDHKAACWLYHPQADEILGKIKHDRVANG